MSELTQSRLQEVLRYEPESGLFFWVAPTKYHPRLRDYVAGGISTGYVMIKVDGRKYKAHRLAWLYTHGEWPAGDLDHANGSPLDNRIANLRPATNPQNQANRSRTRGKATPKGVKALPSGRFQARIRVNHELIHLGTFATAEQAQQAYLAAARTHYGQFARAS